MPTHFTPKLDEIEKIIANGLDADATVRILEILGGAGVAAQDMEHGFLYSETLPKGREPGFTPMQRHLHFLWDAFDKLPLSLIAPFSIPFRRLLAGHLFEKRGEAFVCEENVRFNFGQFLSIGDNVFINRNVFLDTKGGIIIGDSVGVAEDARIFTHGHSESSHMERTYKPVVIEDYAKIYSGVTIFPGVRVGREAIVASGALVTHDVPAGMVVAGMPAQVIRERQSHGRHGDDLDHIWLF